MSSGYMSSSSIGENKYWITGKDIHKKIITAKLQDFLGPEATVRSYTNNGEDGFLISTPGDCLSDEQIDEICRQSKHLWERQAADRRPSVGGPTTGLKRPLHKPVVISRARPRSSSGNPSNNPSTNTTPRRPFGHRGSFHASSLFQPPQQRARHPYPPQQQQQQQQQQPPPRPYSAMNHYDQYHPPPPPPSSSHYQTYDTGDDRYAPYQHRRGQRSFGPSNSPLSPLSPLSNSQCDYGYDAWGELPTPIGPPSSAQS